MATLKDDIARLIAEHGYKAIENEIKKARHISKKGRPDVNDEQELKNTAWLDAGPWVFGQDIREGFSDNLVASIAASFEAEHNRERVNRRIRRKLAGLARLERVLRLMANLDQARRYVSRMLFVKDREAFAIMLNERAKQELSELLDKKTSN